MGLTGKIEQFLLEQLEIEQREYIEIGRNELAERFNCAPSQINYVLSTRFTPYKGYYIESRRGGSGYINRILSETIKDSITLDKVKHILQGLTEEDVIEEREALLITHSLDDHALRSIDINDRNYVRASIFKNVLLALLRD